MALLLMHFMLKVGCMLIYLPLLSLPLQASLYIGFPLLMDRTFPIHLTWV